MLTVPAGWLGEDGGESSAGLPVLLSVGRWPLPNTETATLHLSEALSSLAETLLAGLTRLTGALSCLLGAALAGLSSLAAGLLTAAVYTLVAVQVRLQLHAGGGTGTQL